jgi:hypothetical protein
MMAMMRTSFFSIAARKQAPSVLVRGFHMDTTRAQHHDENEILYDMISSGAHSSTERITKFMNGLYVNKPRSVSLFSFNYRQQTERSTIRGICIGTNSRRGPAALNAVVVGGVPLQEPSLIGVALYVAAVLARRDPMLPRDVAVIPLASPKEYEQRWRKTAIARHGKSLTSSSSSSSEASFSESVEAASNWLAHENVSLDLKDTCKPLETYITRKNKYFINLDVDLTAQGSSITYKGNSLSNLTSKGKFRDFFSLSSPPPLPLPAYLQPSPSPASSSSSSFLIPEPQSSLLDSILEAPSIVLELKGKEALDDEQVVRRGEEIISMLKELLTPPSSSSQ